MTRLITWFIELQNRFNESRLFKTSMIYVLNWVDDLTSWQLIAFFNNCLKSHILKKLLVWVSMKVDYSIHLLTWRQMKILSVESAIRFFNFIISIFEVESSLMMSLASLFSLRWYKVFSSSNQAISADRALFFCSIWALTWSAAFARRWSSATWVLHAFFAAFELSMICLLKLRRQLTLTAASAVFALTAVSTMILAATSALTLRATSAFVRGLPRAGQIGVSFN